MKHKPITTARLILAITALGLTLTLISWDFKQPRHQFQNDKPSTDTLPKEKKIRNLDDVLNELDRAEWNLKMGKAQKEMEDAWKKMEKVDMEKMKAEWEQAMNKVDWGKMKDEWTNAMKEVDMAKIKAEID